MIEGQNPLLSNLRAVNVVISTPENREGAVRAGLQLGDHLNEYLLVDTLKMGGHYDEDLANELGLSNKIHQIPSRTILRDLCNWIHHSPKNYPNTLIWTALESPRPLEGYDIAHIHNAVPLAGMATAAFECILADVPYCVTTHGLSKIPDLPDTMEMSAPAKLAFRLGFLRPYFAILKRARHLFALSEHDREIIQEHFPAQSVNVVPNGVRPNPPKANVAARLEEEQGIPTSVPFLLFVGNLMPSKGIDDLLAAMNKIRSDYMLAIVGPAKNSKYVEAIEAFGGGRVEYLGYVDQNVLVDLYQRADLFVFPTRSDVFPLVTLEAMAAQTPVISTKVGGIPEQVTPATGTLVEPESPDELAAAIDEILSDNVRREAMAERALERVKTEFSWERAARKTAETYEKIVGRS